MGGEKEVRMQKKKNKDTWHTFPAGKPDHQLPKPSMTSTASEHFIILNGLDLVIGGLEV